MRSRSRRLSLGRIAVFNFTFTRTFAAASFAALVASVLVSGESLVACADSQRGDTFNSNFGDASAEDTGLEAEAETPAPPRDAGAETSIGTGVCAGKNGQLGSRTVEIDSGGRKRNFDLFVPAKYDASKPVSLVFLFHGNSMNPTSIADASKFEATAEDRNFILALPNGYEASFNAGDCCGSAQTDAIDDVAFTRDIVAKIATEYCIDPKRIFASGFSNGGFMAYRLACEASDVFASIASVAGVLGVDEETCAPKHPVSVLHVHGTSDGLVPFYGGVFRSVDATVDIWKTKNATDGGAETVFDKGDTGCKLWKGSGDVELCSVFLGGHQWPGGNLLPYGGTPSIYFDATKTIVDFFEAHPMP